MAHGTDTELNCTYFPPHFNENCEKKLSHVLPPEKIHWGTSAPPPITSSAVPAARDHP